ncbi:MAG: family 20 glycosylhydrolase [Anaerostipes sp.]|nr:family 20 glycosylhydrolase [Anaerostipes sp.]
MSRRIGKSVLQKLVVFVLIVSMCSFFAPSYVKAASEWCVKEDTEIFWVSTQDSSRENTELSEQIQLFDSELKACGATENVCPITYGEQKDAGQNDIVLILDSTLGLLKEGYKIEVGDQLIVSASDEDGLFYGCRYVEQAILAGNGLEIGQTYTDAPDCPERAFFLDCGRKYYSPEWIKDMIREMSWSNMNTIYLHFSEEMGFRLESKTYPWLAGADNTLCVNGSDSGVEADNGKYITQDEMRQIAEVAKLYHVEIIPSLDSPGHMNYAVKKYKEEYDTDIGNYFHYNGKTSIVQGSGPEAAQKSYSRGIDISNEEAVTFAQNLYKEYAAFFRELGCTKFDIGGDELLGWGSAVVSTSTASRWKQLDHWKAYAQERAKAEGISNYSDAVAYDGFMYYMNDIYDLVSGYGYTSVRMWNDDALRTSDTGYQSVVELDKNMEIQYWTPDANSGKNNIWTYLNKGYQAYNFLNSYNYYVLGNEHTESGSGSYEGCTQQRIYENWTPYVFAPYGDTNTGKNVSTGNANVKGSAFCVWCDNPNAETAEQVKTGVLPFLRANGRKAWDADANDTLSYADFQSQVGKTGNVPTNLPSPSEIEEVRGINPDLILYKAKFKTTKMTRGKTATLNVLTSKNVDSIELYDDFGNKVKISKQQKTNALTLIEDSVFTCVLFSETNRGTRTYTIYALDAEGNRSAESIQASIVVR